MKNVLICIADSEHLKIFRRKTDPLKRQSVELLDTFTNREAKANLSQRFSDKEGNFAHSTGESKINLELKKRFSERILERIQKSLDFYTHDAWFLAAPTTMNKYLLHHMTPVFSSKMKKNLTSNLVHTPNKKLLLHFS